MAKHGKVLPARRPRERSTEGESVLLRSAETIGRMIGSLQRQIDGSRGRLSRFVVDQGLVHGDGNGNGSRRPEDAKQKLAVRAANKTTKKAKRSAKSTQARKATKRTRKSR